MLLLPCLPCMDSDECSEPAGTEVSQLMNHNDHEQDEEACGPFCNCICCGSIVNSNFHLPKIAELKAMPAKTLRSYYNSISLPSDYFGNIWQPPRVG
jgi:hypothetical protein